MTNSNQNQLFANTLFKTVYKSSLCKVFSSLLLIAFLYQPFLYAQAEELVILQEEAPVESSAVVDEVVEVVEVVEEQGQEEDVVEIEEPEETVVPATEDLDIESVEVYVVEIDTDQAGEFLATTSVDSVVDGAQATVEGVSTSTESTSSEEDMEGAPVDIDGEMEESDDVNEESGDVDGEDDSNPDSSNATTTAPVYAVTTSNTASSYTFDRAACVAVGDGSFYCSDAGDGAEMLEDAFYAQPDLDGDLEIFARLQGVVTQVTSNLFEDAAPYYDARSKTLVWHRLIEDRYQIVSYDMETGRESILTRDTVNNMQPARFGEYTVWQRWVGNNWEIMLHDGSRAVQISNSVHHDIAPSVRGEHVLWKTVKDNRQIVSVYDITTEETITIADASYDAVLSNPRLVLVYDATTEAGDVVTKGFDPLTGDIMALANLPNELPEEIPESDQTGETRALPGAKPTADRDEDADDEDDTTFTPPEENLATTLGAATSTIATTTPETLIIPPIVATSTPEIAEEYTLEVTEIIEEVHDVIASSTDLVIPLPLAEFTEE